MDQRLAIDGGTPTRTSPWPPWPSFAEDEVEAAAAVLRSGAVNYWTGPAGRRFETEFADFVGAEHAIALANGTIALELALSALGVGEGDDVIVPARTFVATAGAVATRGARPIVADVDPTSQNVTAESLDAAVTPTTKGVVVVHLAGWPADMPAIMAWARGRDLFVIEDCAQALGATIGGAHVGTFGDAAAFSFCQDKILTTGGEGGMLVTDDEDLFKLAWSLKDHGKGYDLVFDGVEHTGVDFRWLTERFGTNGRMTEMQAAVGISALEKLPAGLQARRSHAATLDTCFASVPGLRTAIPPAGIEHARYKHYAFVVPSELRADWTRSRIAEAVAAEGVPCFTGACPEIQFEDAFRVFALPEHLTVARQLGETSLMFQVHPTLGDAEMRDLCDAVTKVMAEAVRP